MKAMVLSAPRTPWRSRYVPIQSLGRAKSVRVEACAVAAAPISMSWTASCHTRIPLVPGTRSSVLGGVGAGEVPGCLGRRSAFWLGHTCGCLQLLLPGDENCADHPLVHGLYARWRVRHPRPKPTPPLPSRSIATPIRPRRPSHVAAGLIGWRCLRKAGDGRRIGLYGFGAGGPHRGAWFAGGRGERSSAFTRSSSDKRRTGPRLLARRALDRRLGRSPAGSARRGHHLRARRALGSTRAGGRAKGGGGRLRRHPHERHTVVSLSGFFGRSGRFSRSPIQRARTRSNSWPSHKARGCRDSDGLRVDAPMTLSADLREGRHPGAAVLVP